MKSPRSIHRTPQPTPILTRLPSRLSARRPDDNPASGWRKFDPEGRRWWRACRGCAAAMGAEWTGVGRHQRRVAGWSGRRSSSSRTRRAARTGSRCSRASVCGFSRLRDGERSADRREVAGNVARALKVNPAAPLTSEQALKAQLYVRNYAARAAQQAASAQQAAPGSPGQPPPGGPITSLPRLPKGYTDPQQAILALRRDAARLSRFGPQPMAG